MSSPRLVNHAARGIPNSFVEEVNFIGRRADVFEKPGPALDAFDRVLLQLAKLFKIAGPRLLCRFSDR